MEQDRDGAARVVVDLRPLEIGLQEARGADDDRVDELEVARVRVEADGDLLAGVGLVDALGGRSGT